MKRLILIFTCTVLVRCLSGQTTEYTEFLQAYDANHAWIENVNMTAKVVSKNYTPDPSHTYVGNQADIYTIFNCGSALKGREFVDNGIGKIIELVEKRMIDKVVESPDEVITEVEEFLASEPAKRDELVNAIRSMDKEQYSETYRWWTLMKEYLIGGVDASGVGKFAGIEL